MPFPISLDEIAKTETKTGFTFPEKFKTQFVKDNGGEVESKNDDWQLIPFLDTSDRKKLARTCNDIVRETASMRKWSGFPDDAFVVAQNGGGDYLILLPDVAGSKKLGETIFFWNHETHDYEPVAGSLDAMRL